ncbi:ATP-dependent Clp protease adaptor ClpS [Hugenholtzia roseola]|uniref:ATP-dependent Clp protease adaptor ClpS n=1 Tax=Hugenholtzia roseola TaxID=1002 RepID=UPI000416D9CE|nr:ATP-dependent Clp protease adaptor ClpS [Hugenholtzia roseola]
MIFHTIRLSAPEVEVLEQVETEVIEQETRKLIVYNDDVNTFEHVINTLVDVCGHSREQAEQCTWIIHFKGKCNVKKGDYDTLSAMCLAILDRGISANVE